VNDLIKVREKMAKDRNSLEKKIDKVQSVLLDAIKKKRA
jgi:hypothetical protein